MSTLQNRRETRTFYLRKRVVPYAIVTIFCALLSYIYLQFSHGVSSPHITYLFAYPLTMGIGLGALAMILEKEEPQSFFATHFYHTGVVALIISSILRGVFEIAGTSSIYEDILLILGISFVTFSFFGYIINRIFKRY